LIQLNTLQRDGQGLRRKSAPPGARQNGFTLIEMLVVLVLVGLLAGLVGPRLFSRVDTAKAQTAQAQIKLLKGAIETLRLDVGEYPQTADGLNSLVTQPTDAQLAARWRGPYLEGGVPLDPWGRPYQYVPPADSKQPFRLISFGADGKPGGTGNDADVGDVPSAEPQRP
jgi:general secretion pathway protein G